MGGRTETVFADTPHLQTRRVARDSAGFSSPTVANALRSPHRDRPRLHGQLRKRFLSLINFLWSPTGLIANFGRKHVGGVLENFTLLIEWRVSHERVFGCLHESEVADPPEVNWGRFRVEPWPTVTGILRENMLEVDDNVLIGNPFGLRLAFALRPAPSDSNGPIDCVKLSPSKMRTRTHCPSGSRRSLRPPSFRSYRPSAN